MLAAGQGFVLQDLHNVFCAQACQVIRTGCSGESKIASGSMTNVFRSPSNPVMIDRSHQAAYCAGVSQSV